MPMVFAGMITSTNSSQGIPFFTRTWTVDRCRGMRILGGNPWLVGGLIGICSQSPRFARNMCRLAPFLLPKPKSTPGVTIGRLASSESCARPAWAARSYP